MNGRLKLHNMLNIEYKRIHDLRLLEAWSKYQEKSQSCSNITILAL